MEHMSPLRMQMFLQKQPGDDEIRMESAKLTTDGQRDVDKGLQKRRGKHGSNVKILAPCLPFSTDFSRYRFGLSVHVNPGV